MRSDHATGRRSLSNRAEGSRVSARNCVVRAAWKVADAHVIAAVMRLVLSRVFILVWLGVVIGGVVSAWVSRFVATLLYGIEPRDPATLVTCVAVLVAVA